MWERPLESGERLKLSAGPSMLARGHGEGRRSGHTHNTLRLVRKVLVSVDRADAAAFEE
jgi:hypothetical protein